MNTGDRPAFIKVWAATWSTYGRTVEPAGIDLAFKMLAKRYTLAQVRAGIEMYATDPAHAEFPPTAAAIIGKLEGNPADRAIRGWAKALPLLSGGTHNYVVFDDRVIHQVVSEMGGFRYLGSGSEETHFLELKFKSIYESIVNNPQARDDYPSRLELSVSKTNCEHHQVLYVGDREQCLMVEQQGGQLEALGLDVAGLITNVTHA